MKAIGHPYPSPECIGRRVRPIGATPGEAVRARTERSPEFGDRRQTVARRKKGARNLFLGDCASRSIERHE
jgi:hypothetical protein